MTKLYSGIAFSPQTTLAANLGAADTVIKVADASVFPDAPNFATIGTDEEGETILYAAKADGLLSGCTRGVEGAAKAWQAGAVIARNFTARDHNDLIAAVTAAQSAADAARSAADTAQDTASAHEQDAAVHIAEGERKAWDAKQDKLTGTPGQVVGFGLNGSAEPVPGWSNPNLIINWDFRDPVNRNGKTEYAGFESTIDRWNTEGTIVKVEDDWLQLENPSDTSGSQFVSNFEAYRIIDGQTYTSSLLIKDLVGSGVMVIQYREGAFTYLIRVPLSDGLISASGNLSTSGINLLGYTIVLQPNSSVKIIAAKLEPGDHQTLSRQNKDGEWEIIDPPNYDLQYALCSLYSPTTGEWVGDRHTNPNLLDNWYFLDAINQRGQTEYSGIVYTIDRWRIYGGKVTIGDGCITVSPDAVITQILPEELRIYLNGKQITATFLTKEGEIYTGTGVYTLGQITILRNVRTEQFQTQLYIGESLQFYDNSKTLQLVAAKLEPGPIQTLARKEGDAWVLNDPPPNKALELLKCRRYLQYYAGGWTATSFGKGEIQPWAKYIRGGFVYPIPMRVAPSLILRSIWNKDDSSAVDIVTQPVVECTDTSISALRWDGSDNAINIIQDKNYAVEFFLSAEL